MRRIVVMVCACLALAQTAQATTPSARELGPQGVVELDPATGVPRSVARLDGFLTPASTAPAADVALGYVRAHADLLGAVGELRARPAYVSIDGTTHLEWQQTIDGLPVFGAGLQADVDGRGRLIDVVRGAPVDGLSMASAGPGLSAAQALDAARAKLGLGAASPAEQAAASPTLVAFALPGVARRAWHLWVADGFEHDYETVVDAGTGRVLFRRDAVLHAAGSGSRWRYNPSPLFDSSNGLADGHTSATVSYPDAWGAGGRDPLPAARLAGNNAHVYSDLDDDGVAQASEEVQASGAGTWAWPFTAYVGLGCTSNYPCSWDSSNAVASIEQNRKQAAQQAFWFVNDFHDHLAAAPIGFTEAAGNFQAVNSGAQGRGGDALEVATDDGAATDTVNGGPDANHLNVTTMRTREDGRPPRMRLSLFSDDSAAFNAADEADLVDHEYAHGMTSRLVTDAQGFPRLGGAQAGAMGEGWSDFYALDHLVAQNLDADTSAVGDLRFGFYVSQGKGLRSEGIDCRVTDPGDCTGGQTGHTGGYTYADFGKVAKGPDVHADGEIWGQTLWQLRQALPTGGCPGGSAATCSETVEALVTRGLELVPPDPSMLDARNAILQADRVLFGGAHQTLLWQVFAQRGLGFFAATRGSTDTQPVADFHTPPAAATSSLSGVVTDADSHGPVAGATVAIPGHAGLSATTDADGRYRIAAVPAGTYPYVTASAPGYDASVLRGVAVSGASARDFGVRRDWAAASGGAKLSGLTGPDLSAIGCGPGGAIDQSLAHGWASYAPGVANPGHGLPASRTGARSVVVTLPRAVDVTGLGIDPTARCGDDDATASLRGYEVELSSDGKAFSPAASGTFGSADLGRVNAVTPTNGTRGVVAVRITMLGNQGADADPRHTSYRTFLDMAELEVFGTATPGPVMPPSTVPTTTPTPTTPATPAAPATQPVSPAPGGGTAAARKASVSLVVLTKGKKTLRAALRKGVRLRATCSTACTATVKLTLARAAAKKLGLGRRALVVASTRVSLKAGVARTVTVRFTKKAARRLRRARTLKLSAVAAAGTARATATVTLRR